MEDHRFFDTIYIKQNIADRLATELAKPQWKREVVNVGGITDSYQPIEAEMQLMPDILKLLIQYKTPCIISTKSDLILRDFDLLDQLSRITYVNVAATITTTDETLRKKLEPGGVPSDRRFSMLKAFAKTKVHTGLHAMPLRQRRLRQGIQKELLPKALENKRKVSSDNGTSFAEIHPAGQR